MGETGGFDRQTAKAGLRYTTYLFIVLMYIVVTLLHIEGRLWFPDKTPREDLSPILAKYRREARARTDEGRAMAYDDWMLIMPSCGIGVVVLFLATVSLAYYYDDKDQRKLHNYVEAHHQDADTVEEEVGNVEKMREMEEARKAAAVRSRHRRGAAFPWTNRSRLHEQDDPFGGPVVHKLTSADIFEGRIADKKKEQERKEHHVGIGDAANLLSEFEHEFSAATGLDHIPGRSQHVKSAIERAFDTVDKDRSGKLNREEFAQAMELSLGVPPSEEDLDKLMQELDPNGDGAVTFKEFKEHCTLSPSRCGRRAFGLTLTCACRVGNGRDDGCREAGGAQAGTGGAPSRAR